MSIFENFGCRKVINASGKMTALGASAVAPVVADAVRTAAMDYVDIEELMVAAGRVIASVTGAEDGCPTTGAAAGTAIATAAVIAGTNLTRIESIPHTQGVPNEIIIQKGHAVHFGASITQMISIAGGKVVEVGQANHVEKQHIEEAVTDNTAALFYVKSHHAVQKGMQSIETMLSIAKAKGIPLIIDAAAEEDLRKYIAMGADLVVYSGGKAIEGPTSGMICGRATLIEACRAQYHGVGRPMKIGKEGIVGFLTALQRYDDRPDESVEQRKRMEWLINELKDTPGIKGAILQDEAGRAIFRAQLAIDPKVAGLTAYEVIHQLESGNPAIFTRNHYANLNLISIDPRPLLEGQETLIAERLKQILL
ncbi:DgaE family pyridoxal phosphate-dependent ammonia lyase [Paenibacillus frigoriresistens]|uniref:DgaE family pyridoxal phosphate-dependent ammonia lyase n=1 Tax=Paenibacillus alginolyticus TaxID=59839 RepID=UPI001564E7A6|nr:DgaE family pyridoxal phosphate-dependent ammonia lyase [Paenibacillus frigoriresistens]NRF95854.1 DgaE family pyridoxal phosphate-dependent ammonia lyase [Paenibacillus frigoriresistens]